MIRRTFGTDQSSYSNYSSSNLSQISKTAYVILYRMRTIEIKRKAGKVTAGFHAGRRQCVNTTIFTFPRTQLGGQPQAHTSLQTPNR